MQAKSEARGTGRTTKAITRALIAAALGKRVLYVAAGERQATDCANMAHGLAEQVLAEFPNLGSEVSITGNAVTIYRDGKPIGNVYFRGLDYATAGDINMGLSEAKQYQYVYDHCAEEVLEQERLRLERVAAEQQIMLLMKKHAIWSATMCGDDKHFFIKDESGTRHTSAE